MASVRGLAELSQFQRVQLDGHYDNSRQFLLDNMTDGGSAGYHVLTLFRAAASRDLILVDRGWIAKDFRSALPPDIRVAEDQRTIVARVSRLPRPGIELGGKLGSPGELAQGRAIPEFRKHFGHAGRRDS